MECRSPWILPVDVASDLEFQPLHPDTDSVNQGGVFYRSGQAFVVKRTHQRIWLKVDMRIVVAVCSRGKHICLRLEGRTC